MESLMLTSPMGKLIFKKLTFFQTLFSVVLGSDLEFHIQ